MGLNGRLGVWKSHQKRNMAGPEGHAGFDEGGAGDVD